MPTLPDCWPLKKRWSLPLTLTVCQHSFGPCDGRPPTKRLKCSKRKKERKKEHHLDLCNVSISGWEFHQRSASRWFHSSHSDDEVSPIAELMCGERVKTALSRAPNPANRRVKPAVTNGPKLGLYWTVSGSHPWYIGSAGVSKGLDGEEWSEVEWISEGWGYDNM